MERRGNLKDYGEILKSTNVKELEEQIEVRKDLLERMVGNLYPPLLRGQIIDLRMRVEELKKHGEDQS